VPVGCVPLAVIHPPLVGHGWYAEDGCCTYAVYHRTVVNFEGGEPWTSEQFAIDFFKLGPNNSSVKPNVTLPTTGKDPASYWDYGMPVLAVAPGVVTEAVDIYDNTPVGKPAGFIKTEGAAPGNHVILDIGGGRYVAYAHLKPGSVVVKVGQHVQVGQLIGNVGNSGSTVAPHMHFQVMDGPSFFASHSLPFVFDTQVFEGHVSEADIDNVDQGMVVAIDRTGAPAVKRNLMPARNDVFGFNLSR